MFIVQDAPEEPEPPGESSRTEEQQAGEASFSDPSINDNSVPPVEAVETPDEIKVPPPRREARTPPPKLPVKLLPRLGSLDSQYKITVNTVILF